MNRWLRRLGELASHLRHEPVATATGLVVLPVGNWLIKSERLTLAKYFAWVKNHWEPSNPAPKAEQIVKAKRIARAVYFGARVWDLTESSCLARSSLIWTLCRRANLEADVAVGINPDDFGSAHAWVEIDSVPVDDTDDVTERYGKLDRPLSGNNQTVA